MKKIAIFLALCLFHGSAFASISFDGTDDYVDSNYGPNLSSSDSFSIMGWFIADGAATGEDHITGALSSASGCNSALIQIGFDSVSGCGANNGKRLLAYIRDDSGNQTGPLCANADTTLGVVHSFAFIYDDANADTFLYEDNTLVASNTSTTAIGAKNFTTPEFAIGARNNVCGGAVDSFFPGKVLEIAYWRTALTAAQVAQYHNSKMMDSPCHIAPASLEKYFRMQDGNTGTSADGDSVCNTCGSTAGAATGNDGANNTGLTWASQNALNYPQSTDD